MNSLPLSRAIALAFLSLSTIAGCSNAADSDSDVAAAAQHETASSGCVSYETAKAAFDHDVQAAQDKLHADYDAAMAQYNDGVAAAKAAYDAVLASIPSGTKSNNDADILNDAVNDYNAKVAPDGPLHQAYDASVAAAKAAYDQSTKAATDKYNSTICH